MWPGYHRGSCRQRGRRGFGRWSAHRTLSQFTEAAIVVVRNARRFISLHWLWPDSSVAAKCRERLKPLFAKETTRIDRPLGRANVMAIKLVNAAVLYVQRIYFCRSEEHTSELQSLRHLVCRL